MNKKIIYIDDEAINTQLFKAHFRNDYNVFTTNSQTQALHLIYEEKIKVVITDFKMPNMNGLELIERIKKSNPDAICMILSGYLETEVLNDHSFVFDYIRKPFKKEYLKAVIEKAFTELSQNS